MYIFINLGLCIIQKKYIVITCFNVWKYQIGLRYIVTIPATSYFWYHTWINAACDTPCDRLESSSRSRGVCLSAFFFALIKVISCSAHTYERKTANANYAHSAVRRTKRKRFPSVQLPWKPSAVVLTMALVVVRSRCVEQRSHRIQFSRTFHFMYVYTLCAHARARDHDHEARQTKGRTSRHSRGRTEINARGFKEIQLGAFSCWWVYRWTKLHRMLLPYIVISSECRMHSRITIMLLSVGTSARNRWLVVALRPQHSLYPIWLWTRVRSFWFIHAGCQQPLAPHVVFPHTQKNRQHKHFDVPRWRWLCGDASALPPQEMRKCVGDTHALTHGDVWIINLCAVTPSCPGQCRCALHSHRIEPARSRLLLLLFLSTSSCALGVLLFRFCESVSSQSVALVTWITYALIALRCAHGNTRNQTTPLAGVAMTAISNRTPDAGRHDAKFRQPAASTRRWLHLSGSLCAAHADIFDTLQPAWTVL